MHTAVDMPCSLSLTPCWPQNPVYTFLNPSATQAPPLPPRWSPPLPAQHADFAAPLLGHADSFLCVAGVEENEA